MKILEVVWVGVRGGCVDAQGPHVSAYESKINSHPFGAVDKAVYKVPYKNRRKGEKSVFDLIQLGG